MTCLCPVEKPVVLSNASCTACDGSWNGTTCTPYCNINGKVDNCKC